MICKQCGKALDDSARFCPCCGAETSHAQAAPDARPIEEMPISPSPAKETEKWSVLAIVSFAISVACVLGYIGGGYIVHIATLVMSIIALSRIRKDPTMKGDGFAIAGIVISAVSVGLFFVAMALLIILPLVGIAVTGFAGVIFGFFDVIFEFFKSIFESSLLLPTLLF